MSSVPLKRGLDDLASLPPDTKRIHWTSIDKPAQPDTDLSRPLGDLIFKTGSFSKSIVAKCLKPKIKDQKGKGNSSGHKSKINCVKTTESSSNEVSGFTSVSEAGVAGQTCPPSP